MTKLKPITLRIPQEDYEHLELEAEKLQIRPGTLARILLHSVLAQRKGEVESQDAFGRLQQLIQSDI
jgi:hypothetical protein